MSTRDESSKRLSEIGDLAGSLSRMPGYVTPNPIDRMNDLKPLPVMRSPIAVMADHSLNAASMAVRSLASQIREVEAQLDDESAIAFWVAGGPSGQAFFPREVFAEDPDRIVFRGIDENSHPYVLVQHVTQLNIAIRVAKTCKEEPRQPIGFHFPD